MKLEDGMAALRRVARRADCERSRRAGDKRAPGARPGPLMRADLAVIVVSTNEAKWLTPCLSSVYEHGPISLEVVVADDESTDGTRELVESAFPDALVVTCRNRGFGHANNRGVEATDSRYVLLLNPDTEILQGTLAGLIDALDARPTVGAVGVRQVTPDGRLDPTIRRFSTATRWFFEAIGS